ncbi:biliverdin-producing heme oxygenase [Sphingomonas sp. ac-8]|uniref:biliverdin-producing heme oxygenase n=1 Tax=Sphingomonas sp. ac-8 TaxID=3242977 RepID=UPI003A803724
MPATIELPLSKRLRDQTQDTHQRLDGTIMAADAFATREGYARFVAMQWLFHRDIEALYRHPALATSVPDLATRSRIEAIERDLADLGQPLPATDAPPRFAPGEPVDVAQALGWLYVAEGSNLGAALLRKEAAKLGLSDAHGARHLAPTAEGPAEHWRRFTARLDAALETEAEERRAVAGAEAAFARVQALADARLG